MKTFDDWMKKVEGETGVKLTAVLDDEWIKGTADDMNYCVKASDVSEKSTELDENMGFCMATRVWRFMTKDFINGRRYVRF